MSKRQIHAKGRIPSYWEWSCDFCGKTAHTNGQTTRPPGWVPLGRTLGKVPDFCSEEHQTEYNKGSKKQEDDKPDVPTPPADNPTEVPTPTTE